MPIKINGATSGSTTITAPATGGDETIELSTALAAKANLASSTYTGTHDFTGATVTGLPAAGLSPVTPTSIANSGGSASLSGSTVSFTGVTAIALNGVFTASFTDYLVLATVVNSAGNNDINMRLRASGSDAAGSNYERQYILGNNTTLQTASVTTDSLPVAVTNTVSGFSTIQLSGPAVAAATRYVLTTGRTTAIQTASGFHSLATAYDGLTLLVSGANMTGRVTVYGYKA